MIKIDTILQLANGLIKFQKGCIKQLEQENADLKRQLKQCGVDARELANTRLANGAKKGLFLK